MRQLPNLLNKFIKEHSLSKSSAIRLLGALGFSALTSICTIYYNNENYWNVTVKRIQTVDFNILANTLPSKLSTQLLNNDQKGLQETLDSNYGLFGIIVTDCKSTKSECPQQKIIYASKIIVKTAADGKQKLEIKKYQYLPSWAERFNDTDYPAKKLNGDFLILRDPPPIKQEWKFDSPRSIQKTLTGKQNYGNVIGRVYLLRGNSPSFQSELLSWWQNPWSNSGKNVVYNAIIGSAVLTGVLVWLLTELASYIKINADRQELQAEQKIRQATELRLESEQRIRQTTEQVLSANQATIEARNSAREYRRIAESIQESESRTQAEKLEAEQRAIDAEQRAQQLENQLQQERGQLDLERQDIIGMIDDDNNQTIENLRNENNNLQQNINNLRNENNNLQQSVNNLRNENNNLQQSVNNLRNENHELTQRINAPPASHRDRSQVVNVQEVTTHHRPKSWGKLRPRLENLEWIELVSYNEVAFAAPVNGIQRSNRRMQDSPHIFYIHLYDSQDTRMAVSVQTTGYTNEHAEYTETILRKELNSSL